MDAFESIVAQVLDVGGYWTRIGVKVDFTKEDKRAVGNPSMPRPEIDIVAYKPKTNELLLVECKSWLDSGGVNFASFSDPNSEFYNRFKIFNDARLRALVVDRLIEGLQMAGLVISEKPSVQLVLAAGQIYKKDEQNLAALFTQNGWRLITPSDITEAIRLFAKKGYENNAVTIVTKMLERNKSL